MFQPASVSLSGPAFSFLLYETSKGCVRQDGFLLGEIVHKEITSITDNDQKQVDISKIIKINSVVPCPKGNYFIKGKIDTDKIRKFLGPNFNKVVAWYKYEPFSSLKLTLKDKAMHKQFRELFDIAPDLFSFCLVSMECANNFSSYNYQQIFFRYGNGCFDRLGIQISNLSEANNTYKNSEPASDVFTKILSSIDMDVESTKGVVAVREIENAVQKYINNTVTDLAKAEKTLFDLECEIANLRLARNSEVVKNNNDNMKDSKVTAEDVISTESPELPTNEKCGNSPEVIRKSPRTRNKTLKKCENDNDMDISAHQDIKKEELPQNNNQTSSEAVKKINKPKNKGKAKCKT